MTKDEADKSIPKGYFILTGKVKAFSSNIPLENVLIGCLSSGIWVRTDDRGNFTVTLKSTDEAVYFYKENWSEVVLENYEFKDQHRIEIVVYLYQPEKPQSVRKPVIYFYSDKDMPVSVQLKPKGNFTFSYPRYDNGWEIEVKANGGCEVAGKMYPYLFWEGESYNIKFQTKQNKLPGYLIASMDVISFLEEKLTVLGLNQKEQTDFITYWGPLLSKKKYALIQFIVDDQYESQIASLNITPEPDHVRRVYLICSGLDDRNVGMEIVPQELNSFERNGFTVVEWGGSILDFEKLVP